MDESRILFVQKLRLKIEKYSPAVFQLRHGEVLFHSCPNPPRPLWPSSGSSLFLPSSESYGKGNSQPSLSSEIHYHEAHNYEHDNESHGITPMPLKLRHKFEIHSVYPGNKCKGDKYGGYDC